MVIAVRVSTYPDAVSKPTTAVGGDMPPKEIEVLTGADRHGTAKKRPSTERDSMPSPRVEAPPSPVHTMCPAGASDTVSGKSTMRDTTPSAWPKKATESGSAAVEASVAGYVESPASSTAIEASDTTPGVMVADTVAVTLALVVGLPLRDGVTDGLTDVDGVVLRVGVALVLGVVLVDDDTEVDGVREGVLVTVGVTLGHTATPAPAEDGSSDSAR